MNINQQPQLKSSFVFRGIKYDIDWYDLGSDLPDLPWSQVYAIGDVDGLTPIVHYENAENDNLPGGRLEPGETVEEALRREIEEEIYHEVVSWSPIGYQKGCNSDGTPVYQLRVCAKLRSKGIFTNDPGGHVVGHSLVPIDKLNSHIKYGDVGDRMVEIAKTKLELLG